MEVILLRAKERSHDAAKFVTAYISYYNDRRLHSAIGYLAPKDKLAGREKQIFAERKRKLREARKRRITANLISKNLSNLAQAAG